MTCTELALHLSTYGDHASPPDERAAVETHLEECEACRARLASMRTLKHAIARLPSKEEPPLAVRARIEALALRAGPSGERPGLRLGRPRARRLRWAAALAGLLACAGAAWMWRSLGGGPEESLDAHLVGDHVLNALGHQKPIEIASDDPEIVERWFQSRLALAVKLPRVVGARVAGGRLCNVAGRLTALTFIDWGTHRLSLFAMPPERSSDSPSCTAGVRGFSVCRRRAEGVEYALVSDLPAHEATRFLASL